MPDPRADPHLPYAVGVDRAVVHVALAFLTLIKQWVAWAAAEVLGYVSHSITVVS